MGRKNAAASAAGACVGNCVVVACCCPFIILHLLVQACIRVPIKLASKVISKYQLSKQRKRKTAAMPDFLHDSDADEVDTDMSCKGQETASCYFSSTSVWGRSEEEESDDEDIDLCDVTTTASSLDYHDQVAWLEYVHSITSDFGFHSLSIRKD